MIFLISKKSQGLLPEAVEAQYARGTGRDSPEQGPARPAQLPDAQALRGFDRGMPGRRRAAHRGFEQRGPGLVARIG